MSDKEVFSMAKGFTKAMIKEAKAVVNNEPKLEESETESRLAICNQCKYFLNGKCSKCKCFMKLKTKLRTASCPIGKW